MHRHHGLFEHLPGFIATSARLCLARYQSANLLHSSCQLPKSSIQKDTYTTTISKIFSHGYPTLKNLLKWKNLMHKSKWSRSQEQKYIVGTTVKSLLDSWSKNDLLSCSQIPLQRVIDKSNIFLRHNSIFLQHQCKPSYSTLSRMPLCSSVSAAVVRSSLGLKALCNIQSNPNYSYLQRRHCSTDKYQQLESTPTPGESAEVKANKFELLNGGKTLAVQLADQSKREFPSLWLRDHCRCQSCYNHNTNQKEKTLDPTSSDAVCMDSVRPEDGSRSLVIVWKDGHTTKLSVDWLMNNSYTTGNNRKVERILWNKSSLEGCDLPSVSYASHVETDEGLRQTLHNLVQFGFSFIHEAPASLEGTQVAVERIAPVLHTIYGSMWEFTPDLSRSDTAYDRGFLGAHTDTTYFEVPAGIQVFQCLHHDGTGGETLLVDGFHAVEQLKKSHPDAVRCLAKQLVPHEYKEAKGVHGKGHGYHIYTLGNVIRLHPATGETMHLRFNPYDMAPLNTIPTEEMSEFYRSYHQLADTIAQPSGQFWVKLQPGTILLIDNWRVMHGRAAFTGKRMLTGCYLPRDEWQSQARMMGLL